MRKYKRLCSMSLRRRWDSDWIASTKSEFKKFTCNDFYIRQRIREAFKDRLIENIRILRITNKIKAIVTYMKDSSLQGMSERQQYVPRYQNKPVSDNKAERPEREDRGKEKEIAMKLCEEIRNKVGTEFSIAFEELKDCDMSAFAIANTIALALSQKKKLNIKKFMLKFVIAALKAGARGVQIVVKGRINGVSIARSEKCIKGSVPKNLLSREIDYHLCTGHTGSGTCGVRVFVNRGF